MERVWLEVSALLLRVDGSALCFLLVLIVGFGRGTKQQTGYDALKVTESGKH